jgi:hypothetical protein
MSQCDMVLDFAAGKPAMFCEAVGVRHPMAGKEVNRIYP